MRQTTAFHLFLAFCLISPVACKPKPQAPVTVDSGYRQVMGTVIRILAVAEDRNRADQAIKAALNEISDIERRMSDYDPASMLSTVNQKAFETPIPVDDQLFQVLSAAMEYSRASDGAFDITIGPVVQLWRKARADGIAPNPEAIQTARRRVGYQNLILDADNKTVKFAKEGMALDLGGIAKGYAIDRAIEVLQDAGLAGGMVDIGGDLRCFGKPANHAAHWMIGLQDPASEKKILLKLKMDDRAVATSGDYRRFFIIDGQKHSHIVDPATADSAQELSSVTIIAPTAMGADALATAVSVLGKEKGIVLIETIEDVEAFLLNTNQTNGITKTTGAGQYIRN